jgi:hypothetical protein
MINNIGIYVHWSSDNVEPIFFGEEITATNIEELQDFVGRRLKEAYPCKYKSVKGKEIHVVAVYVFTDGDMKRTYTTVFSVS